MYTIYALTGGAGLVQSLAPLTEQITNAVQLSDIVGLFGAGLAFALPFALLWMGIRKIKGMAVGAITKGKITG